MGMLTRTTVPDSIPTLLLLILLLLLLCRGVQDQEQELRLRFSLAPTRRPGEVSQLIRPTCAQGEDRHDFLEQSGNWKNWCAIEDLNL